MVYKIIIDPAANLDIIDCIDWYINVQIGLGNKFYQEVKSVFKSISKNPNIFAVRYKNVHTAVMKKFPFLIHYFIDADKNIVVVTSVLHSSRDPKTWYERTL
jgi:plasmid stabilization system protein ParE